MRFSEIQKKYPKLWATIESAVWNDTWNAFPSGGAIAIRRVAYNAAAIAVLEHHKIMTKLKGEKWLR
jgi:hypothetical protein